MDESHVVIKEHTHTHPLYHLLLFHEALVLVHSFLILHDSLLELHLKSMYVCIREFLS
jgi:hypothetical protein